MYTGISASPGLTQGPAFVFRESSLQLKGFNFTNVETELKNFSDALAKSQKELTEIRHKVEKESSADEAAIFESHILMLADPEIEEQVHGLIKEDSLSAFNAYLRVTDDFISQMSSLDDDYLKARALDLGDVRKRVLTHLSGEAMQDLSAIHQPVIIVTDDLTPSQFASLNKKNVLGLVTTQGGKNSHTAIMARVHEIPTLVGVGLKLDQIKNEEWMILDAKKGMVLLKPSADQKTETEKNIEKQRLEKEKLLSFKTKRTLTRDGVELCLEANIGHKEDIALIRQNGCEGMGLFRTEFLFLGRSHAPTEQEQYEVYRQAIAACGAHEAVIRTLDIGGDKQVSYIHIGKEENPFLGLRAVRYCFQDLDLFKTQLRALLRSSVHGNLSIMFPMISSLEEVLRCREIVNECKAELQQKGVTFSDSIKIGIMIEIPAAAIMCDQLAKHVDFFSIGTNDLVQYTCAVDRMNEKVSHLYENFNPAVLRLIARVIETANKYKIGVGVCGEMGGDPLAVPYLLGMGLRNFSQNPSSILRSRELLSRISTKDAKELWAKAQTLDYAKDIKALVASFI